MSVDMTPRQIQSFRIASLRMLHDPVNHELSINVRQRNFWIELPRIAMVEKCLRKT